ncbi:MAG TPA: vWA domain-containing protein, partial [Candidatus Krumholzibacteria bacterium]|nr:vWA domain-containing protein [Candidatus Krumholzibacteria bacterium]
MTLSSLSLPLAKLSVWPKGALDWSLVILLLIVGLAVSYLAYHRTQPSLNTSRRWILRLLRASALLLLLFLILEPVLFSRHSKRLSPSVLTLVDDSGSMTLKSHDGSTRLQDARDLAELAQRQLSGRPEKPQLFSAEGSRRLHREVQAGSQEGTNLPALLLSAAQSHLEDNLQAILLLSDGRSTDPELPSLRGLSLPVFTLAVGDSNGPGDLRLDRVHYPTVAYRGDQIEITAEAVVESANAGHARAILQGGASPDTLSFSWPRGGGRIPLSFVVRADSLGMLRRVLRLTPLPSEALQDNNAIEIGAEVLKDRLHIMIVQSRPGWDFHFLRRRLAEDPRFDVEGVYRAVDRWQKAGSDSTWTPPVDATAAAGVDAWVILSLEDFAQLSERAPGMIASVREGAGLWVLFGEARGQPPSSLSREASELLPVQLSSASRWKRARHRVRLLPAGISSPIFAFPASVGDPLERLEQMPPLWDAVHGIVAKPDADVLLQAEDFEGTTPLLSLKSSAKGTVACWSAAPMWSWSFWRLGEREGEDVYRALVGNLIYYLAEGASRKRLQLILPRPVVARGEDALLRAVVLDARRQPDESSDLWIEWRKEPSAGADSSTTVLGRALMQRAQNGPPGGRQLAIPPLPAGHYQFRLALEESSGRIFSP